MIEQEFSENLVEDKDDIKDNLERTNVATTVLKALSYGIQVKFKWGDTSYTLSMQNGRTYIKGRSYKAGEDITLSGGKPTYMGFGSSIDLDTFIQSCYEQSKSDPKWCDGLRAELAAGVVLNKIEG